MAQSCFGLRALMSALPCAALAACAVGPLPRNYSDARWMPQQVAYPGAQSTQCHRTHSATLERMLPGSEVAPAALRASGTLLAPGDRLRINVVGDENGLSGVFVIGDNGTLMLPGVSAVSAAGESEAVLENRLHDVLIRERLVRPLSRVVRVALIEQSGVSASVTGAVFQPGTVRVGERASDSRVGQREGVAFGDANPARTLSTALRAAGGVRPDADISTIYLLRGDHWARLDMRSAMTGTMPADLQIASGDRVVVPSTGCFDADLVRPGALTQPGVRVFMSNLTRPASNNASSAIGKETTSLPYGTRFLQGLVAANCVGGSAMNAHRHAVLISRNPINGRSVVVERSIEALVRSENRDDWDPYLMPGDGIACYDSRAMNFRDAISLVGDAFGSAAPAIILSDKL